MSYAHKYWFSHNYCEWFMSDLCTAKGLSNHISCLHSSISPWVHTDSISIIYQAKQSFSYSNLFLMTNCSSRQSITVWSRSMKYLLWNIGPLSFLMFTCLCTLERSALVMMQMLWMMYPLLQYCSACVFLCPVTQMYSDTIGIRQRGILLAFPPGTPVWTSEGDR